MSVGVFIAFMLGFGVSLHASGRFTLRLIVDGTLSFAFVPLSQLIAFAVVHRIQRSSQYAQNARVGQAACRETIYVHICYHIRTIVAEG